MHKILLLEILSYMYAYFAMQGGRMERKEKEMVQGYFWISVRKAQQQITKISF